MYFLFTLSPAIVGGAEPAKDGTTLPTEANPADTVSGGDTMFGANTVLITRAPVPLPTRLECADCPSCMLGRGALSTDPARLLRTPPPTEKLTIRTTGLLIQDLKQGERYWVLLVGPYVAGGGHRSLLSRYRKNATEGGYEGAKVRWGGEAVLQWNGRCFVAQALNETSGMIARRELEPLGIEYEELAVASVANLIGKAFLPNCRVSTPFFRDPRAVPYAPDVAHFNEKLRELSTWVPGQNLRHDLINKLFALYGRILSLQANDANDWSDELRTEVRTLAKAAYTFFEVVREEDPVPWSKLDVRLANAIIAKLRVAELRGIVTELDIFAATELVREIDDLRETLEFRVPQ